MARAPSDGFGWRQRWLPPQLEKEEEGYELRDRNAALDVEENRLVESMDCWRLSSSPEILEDAELLQELQDDPHLSDEGELNFDLTDVQDLDCVGGAKPRSPPSANGEDLEEDGNPGDVVPITYWEGQLVVTDEDRDGASLEELEMQRKVWNAGSEGETYPELSYEVQYGSEYSASPEALKDPLALYRPGQSFSFTSDGGEDFSEHSSLSPSPFRPPLEGRRLKMEVFETQNLLGRSLESPQEMESSSPPGRSPESGTFSSPVGSARWSQSFLGHLSAEDLQNVPGIDAETFPESSCAENPGEPIGTVVKVVDTARHCPFISAKPKERRLDTIGRMEFVTPLRTGNDQQPDRAGKLKADVPHGLPSKFTRQSRSLSPKGRGTQKKPDRSSSGEADRANRSSPGTSDAPQYGRGRLNYPLPDLSKVEPRVRFPKDPRRYHPPRGKTRPARSKELGKPVVFKSPAEIVREVLLSSGEGPPQKGLAPMVSVIPEELKSPRQATELVQQLQEDYRKLLTKYAEAENTIDRLRLGTKVRLYADSPKPSQGVQMGTVSQGSKVMTFSIPQAWAAKVSGSPASGPDASWREVAGLQPQQVTFSPLFNSTVSGIPGMDGLTSTDKAVSEDRSTRVLANQARTFQRQVELLEEMIQMGQLTPQDQLKGFARLKEAQGALEQAYLKAREEHWKLQELTGAPGDFDLDRAVEGEIFRLEMRLQELKERIDQASRTQQATGSDSDMTASPSSLPAQVSELQMRSPTPSIQAPLPAVRTPYPEAPIPKDSFSQGKVELEVSSVSDETEGDEEGLPEPLGRKQLQTEKGFEHLLDCYSSFKSLPEALSWEQLDMEGCAVGLEEADGAATEDVEGQTDSHGVGAEVTDTTCSASLQVSQEKESLVLLPRKPQLLPSQAGHLPTGQVEGLSENRRSSAVVPKAASQRKQGQLSQRSSMASVTESAVSELTVQKSFRQTSAGLPEEVRIVSPETDSGFIGSEASRVSPLAQPPKHRSSHARLSSSGGGLEENVRPSRRHKTGRATPHTCLAPRSCGMVVKSVLPDSHAASRTLQTAAHPRKEPDVMESLVTDVAPEGAIQRKDLGNSSSFHLSSPSRWADSFTSELEPETDSTHADSEDSGGLEASKSPPSEMRCSPSSSVSLCPVRTRCYSLLGSRLERDQAIAALQNEVSQLRQSLEETLHRPQKRALLPHASRAPVPSCGDDQHSRSSNPEGKTLGANLARSEDLAPAVKPEERTRKAPLSQDDGTQLDLAPSGSDCSVANHRDISASKTKPPKQLILQGPYTGTRYSCLTPEPHEPKTRKGSASCPPCQDEQPRLGEELMPEEDAKEAADSLPPRKSGGHTQNSSRRKMAPSLRCTGSGSPRRKVALDHGTEDTSAQGKPGHQPRPQHPGLWYLAVPPPTASVGYTTAVPLTPCHPSPVMFCSAPAPTSASTPVGLPIYLTPGHQATELRMWAPFWQPRERLGHSLKLDRDGWCDLNKSLSRALEAAEGLKLTTKRMSQCLTSELSRARSLRGSCLF